MPQRQVIIVGTLSFTDEGQGGGPGGGGGGNYPSHPWVPPQGPEGPNVPGWPNVPGNWPSLPGGPGQGGGGGQPGGPNYPSQGPGFPTNPIQLPPWAGGWQPRPDQGLPPSGQGPGQGPGQGGNVPHPSHPINKPPDQEPPAGFKWTLAYLPGIGWAWVCTADDSQTAPE